MAIRAAGKLPLTRTILVLAAAICTSSLPRIAAAEVACEPAILEAADRYDIPAGILYAVGLTETGHKDSLQPNALNIEGKPLFAASKDKALAAFRKARADGASLIDIGCMQINYRYHGRHFASVSDMLDPTLNVDYAARFLRQLKTKHESWSMTVARYHAGPDNDPAQKRYVCRVIANLVATGFGKWTENAREFCNP